MINLRHAIPDDAPAIARVHVDSWRAVYRGLIPDERLDKMDYARGASLFLKTILEGSEDIYIVEETGIMVGFMALGGCRDADVDQDTSLEIRAMYLLSDYWRKGIGRITYQKSERMLKSRGYGQAIVWVFESNERARRFYEAMGFAVDGRSKFLNIGAPLNTVRYRKNIAHTLSSD